MEIDLQSSDPVAARALLNDMRGVATARNEAPLWELWAKAAVNLMFLDASRDPVAVRALLDDMRSVAEARNEAPLWELWAKAAGDLMMIDLRSGDLVAARGLLDDMLKAVERNPGDVGGWQTKVVGLVLHAGFSLTKDLASRDPDAARAFCTDVLGLPEWMLKTMQFGD